MFATSMLLVLYKLFLLFLFQTFISIIALAVYHEISQFLQLIEHLLLQRYQEYEKIISDMENIYSTAKICDYKNRSKCDLALEPELTEILMKSRDPEELKYIWIEWRKATGEKVKSLYPKYVELSNLAATLNNFSDNAAYWLKDYEADDFPEQIGKLDVRK